MLQPALTIAGTVRDAASGEPVPRFRIIAGSPGADGAAGATNVYWGLRDRTRLNFVGGQFHHVFEEPVVVGNEEPAFVFKFEAEGYVPFVSRVVRASEGLAQFEVRLRAAEPSTVTVRFPDGRPAVNADIGLVVPGNPLTLIPGGCSREPLRAGAPLLTTDGRGRFHLPPDDTITRVVAAHPEGFAIVPVSALSTQPEVWLQPWGRLEGTWRSGDQPVAGRELALGHWALYEAGLKLDSKAYLVKTDREGRFVFPPVPPGRHRLMESKWVVEPGKATEAKVWILRPLLTVDIRPGETATVTVGGGGHTVRARLQWPEGMSRQPNWSFSGILWKASPAALAGATNPASALTAAVPALQPAVVDVRNFPLEEKPDGSWVAADVPAGRYVLKLLMFGPAVAGEPSHPLARAEVPVVVPDDPPGGVLDLGEIPLTPVR